jgi:hypothetical protein
VRQYIAAPAAGYTLLALFADIDTATQASDMKLVQASVVAFSVEEGGFARPVPVRGVDTLSDTDVEFKTIALQTPDGAVTPLTRGWVYKSTRFANAEIESSRSFDTLAAWRVAAWGVLQAQLSDLFARVSSERRRKTETLDAETRIAIAQERIRQDNLAALQRRRDDVDARAAVDAARAAEVAALLEAAGKP